MLLVDVLMGMDNIVILHKYYDFFFSLGSRQIYIQQHNMHT
jgi:hypothetical protein